MIDDAWMAQVWGSSGYRLSGPTTGHAPFPILRAVNLASPGVPGINALDFTAAHAGQSADRLEYLNIHAYAGADALVLRGAQHTHIRRNTCHDTGPLAGEYSGCIAPQPRTTVATPEETIPADFLHVDEHTFYRTCGNALDFNASDTAVFANSSTFNRTLAFEGCTTTSGECNGLEGKACRGCEMTYTVVHDCGASRCKYIAGTVAQ